MTSAEVGAFIRALHGERLRPAFLAAVVLGLRRGELLGLRWNYVDLAGDEPAVEVRQQHQDEAGLVFTTPLGTPVDPDNFRHHLSGITQRAGLG